MLTNVRHSEQYDILHQLQGEAEFGADGQLVVRFPLPRLHHISRWFTEECDSRALARPLVVVSQKHGDIQTFKRLYSWEHIRRRSTAPERDNRSLRREPIGFPRIVNLRHMQSHHFVERLRINLYACNATDAAAEIERPVLRRSIRDRLEWINEFVKNTCSPVVGMRVHIRLMLNDVKLIHMVKLFRVLPHLVRPHSTLKIVVDCPSEEEFHREEFSRAKTLAVMRNGCRWSQWSQCFDDQEIKRCEALAESRSGWSTAAASPTSSESEGIGEYQGVGGCDEINTGEGPDGHGDPPVDPLTMRVAKLS